jgi:hypothetical protein
LGGEKRLGPVTRQTLAVGHEADRARTNETELDSLMKTKLKLHLLLLTLLSLAGFAHAQGTAISYQGRLNYGGSPATGLYDLTFKVFDVVAGGAALAAPVVLDAVPVTNGLFNVSLDFGPNIFIGPARWLEISVRVNAFILEVLTPRTPLLPTPYAIFAGKAGGVASGTLTADQLNSGGVLPMQGQFLSYDGGNFLWRDPAVLTGDVWSVLNNNAYYNADNVGIGTSTPVHRLSIAGGPVWTSHGWLGSIALNNGAAIGWEANASGQRFGMGHSSGGFGMFRTASDPGTSGSPALYDFLINNDGNVGIGTTTPARKLTVRTPGYGLEHTDGTVRLGTYLDPTGGWLGTISDHPLHFFVYDGLPSVTLTAAGNLGIGTVSPQAKLEVNGNVRVNSGSGIALNVADGPMITRGWDPFNSDASLNKGGHGRWGLFMEPHSLVCGFPDIAGKSFEVSKYTPEGGRLPLLKVTQGGIVSIGGRVGIGPFGLGAPTPQEQLHVIGNILASGTITGSSDRNMKRDFTPVNSSEVLDRVAALPISTWSYIADDGVRHLGPMAQDFYSAFSVGMDDKHISMVDADGVALAAIQGLNQKLNEKVTDIGELKSRLERLENLMNQKNGGAK